MGRCRFGGGECIYSSAVCRERMLSKRPGMSLELARLVS